MRKAEKVMTCIVKNRLRNLQDLRLGYMYITADAFGLTVTQLRYRLHLEGATYQALLIAERRRRLDQLLAANSDADLCVADVAQHMGYTSMKAVRLAAQKLDIPRQSRRKRLVVACAA